MYPAIPKGQNPKKGNKASTDKTESNYETVRQKSTSEGILWEDPDFPASSKSIGPNAQAGIIWLRPYEICRYNKYKKPVFFDKGGDRFDINQGDWGDCWVLAAVAILPDNPKLFARVVPPNQTFGSGYAGVFRFRFWRYGTWEEVLVDDRLPTMGERLYYAHSGVHHEFWGALLEKAYAKFYGSFEAIRGGHSEDSLVDLTGGLVENLTLSNYQLKEITQIVTTAAERKSLMVASIYDHPGLEGKGLVASHAYSVTGTVKVPRNHLIRIRNPWGNAIEWNGRWSDSSDLLKKLPPEVKKDMRIVDDSDGEFWMQMTDFLKHFDGLKICHLTPDSLEESPKHWSTSQFHSDWTKDVTAGGRVPSSTTFALNRQYQLAFADHNQDDDRLASFVVELTQKNRRRFGLPRQYIGFYVYKTPPGTQLPLSQEYLATAVPDCRVEQYSGLRTAVKRFAVEPGTYVIIPTAWTETDEGQFMLRVFSEAALQSK